MITKEEYRTEEQIKAAAVVSDKLDSTLSDREAITNLENLRRFTGSISENFRKINYSGMGYLANISNSLLRKHRDIERSTTFIIGYINNKWYSQANRELARLEQQYKLSIKHLNL